MKFLHCASRNLPPPLKKQKIEESPSDIPDVLQGEIARLDQRFKVTCLSLCYIFSNDAYMYITFYMYI